jgi:hypothetical protein
VFAEEHAGRTMRTVSPQRDGTMAARPSSETLGYAKKHPPRVFLPKASKVSVSLGSIGKGQTWPRSSTIR